VSGEPAERVTEQIAYSATRSAGSHPDLSASWSPGCAAPAERVPLHPGLPSAARSAGWPIPGTHPTPRR